MKQIVPFVLFMVIGFILAAGCVTPKKNDTVNTTAATTFAPITNTSDTSLNKTITATTNITPELKGSLKVSISGISYPANLSVVIDNDTVGTVNPTTPLYLMVSEGTHTLMVCANSVCKQENVTIRFGKYLVVDFSEQIQKDAIFANPNASPTARILEYFQSGEVISVNVEFINPSTKDHLMSVVVRCGYSYIDDRTSIKMEDIARRKLEQNVKAGQRITEWLDLYFAYGHSYSYDSPVIEELQIK